MQCEIVVRPATARDLPARTDLVYRSITEYDFDAFIMFFFQELTLQVCVLSGAVLFIFVGCGPCACALVPAGAALLLLAAVLLATRAHAHHKAQQLQKELCGFVAEYLGPLAADPRAVRVELRAGADAAPGARLVGSVSVAECWGPRRSGWLHALCVAPAWRRRGVGAALVAASGAWARRERLQSLEAATSALHDAARALLHGAGWRLRAATVRPVLGAALTMPVALLGIDLPPCVLSPAPEY